MKEKIYNFTVLFLFVWGTISFVRFTIKGVIKTINFAIDRVKQLKKRRAEKKAEQLPVESEEHTFVYI